MSRAVSVGAPPKLRRDWLRSHPAQLFAARVGEIVGKWFLVNANIGTSAVDRPLRSPGRGSAGRDRAGGTS